MNPPSSDSFTAHVFVEFEDDASVFASAEPEFVPTPTTPAPPPSVVAAAMRERLKAELAALPPRERAELARFLIQSLRDKEDDADARSTTSMEAVRQALETITGTLAQAVDDEREER